MPRSAIRVEFGVGRLGQRAMDVLAVAGARRAISRRAHQRMTKPHPRTQLDQPRRLGRRRRVRSDPKPLGHTPQQRHVPHRLGRRRQQQPLRRIRKRPDTPQETLLDLTRQRSRVRTPEPTGQLRRCQPPRQLQQGQRITAGLGDDPIPDALVEPPGEAESRSARASSSRKPGTTSSRSPTNWSSPGPSVGQRTANTTATRSASNRRATKASVCAETRSSH